ncbi:WD40 repeat domain-containing protein [Streptomyces sp. NPDC050287]|uniref:WD40 repeat domain-containing protein n=1 Tax=Streptomyces sp. NPDC050287 TaxID=3365608 RepID=UPI0037B1F4BC
MTPDGKVIDLASGKATHRSLTQGEPTAVALSHDGERLAAGDDSGWVTLWDRRTWRRLGELPICSAVASDGDDSEGVSAMAFSHDGRTLAVGTDDGRVQLWDVTTGLAIGAALYSSGGPVMALAFRKDDRTLYVSSRHVPLERYEIAPDRVAFEVCRRTGSGLSLSEWRTYVRNVPYTASC